MDTFGLIITFVAIVLGVLAQVQLFYRSRSWLFSLEQISPQASMVRYRNIRGGYFTLLWLGLIGLVVAGVYGNRQPTEPLWLVIALASFAYLLTSSFVLVSGYLGQVVLTVTPDFIEVKQKRWFGLSKQERSVRDILRVHYRKVITRYGVECTLLFDTREQLNQVLVAEIYDENIVVTMKDLIITRQNLHWSSDLGVEEMPISRQWW